jgi:hypothetical protein
LDQPQNLENAIGRLLPTPTAMDMGRGRTPEEWDAWTAKMQAEHKNGNGHGRSLEIEAMRLLPTPTARDHKDGKPSNVPTNALLGRTVWTLHDGERTPTPSPDGNPSSDGQHQTPPTTNGD